MPTTFFDLPRELRDNIYDHVWTSLRKIRLPYSAPILAEGYYNYSPPENADMSGFCSLPRGVASNKIMLKEALEAFHRKGVIVIRFQQLDIFKRDYGHITYPMSSSRSIPRELHLRPNIMDKSSAYKQNPFDHDVAVHHSFTTLDKAYFKHLADHAQYGPPEVLKIHVRFQTMHTLRATETIDLEPISAFGRIASGLRKLEIVVDDGAWAPVVVKMYLESLEVEVGKLCQTVLKGMKATVEMTEIQGVDDNNRWLIEFTRVRG
jgi:hypothetical protein